MGNEALVVLLVGFTLTFAATVVGVVAIMERFFGERIRRAFDEASNRSSRMR